MDKRRREKKDPSSDYVTYAGRRRIGQWSGHLPAAIFLFRSWCGEQSEDNILCIKAVYMNDKRYCNTYVIIVLKRHQSYCTRTYVRL